ncbi:hypothetical protein ACVBEF_14955 [Glaciimonas sp. GG7]
MIDSTYTPLLTTSNVMVTNPDQTAADIHIEANQEQMSSQPNSLAKQCEETLQLMLVSALHSETPEALEIREHLEALLELAEKLLSDAHEQAPSNETLDRMADIEESLKLKTALLQSHLIYGVVSGQDGLTRIAAVSNTSPSADMMDADGLIKDIENFIQGLSPQTILAHHKDGMIKEMFEILASGLGPMDETEVADLISEMRKILENETPKMITADLQLILDKKNSVIKDRSEIFADQLKQMHERFIRDMLEVPEVPEVPEGVTPTIVFFYFMMMINKKMNGIQEVNGLLAPRLGQFADEQSMSQALARALEGKDAGDEIDYSELISVHKYSPLRKPGDPEDLKMTLKEMMDASKNRDPNFPKLPNSNSFKDALIFKEDLKIRTGMSSSDFNHNEDMINLQKLRQDMNLFQSDAASVQKEVADVRRKILG